MKFTPKIRTLALFSLLTGALHAQSVFQMPEIFPRHRILLSEFAQAMAAKNYEAAETAARAGATLLPNDTNWAYNVACALSLQGQADAAFSALEKAIRLGFTNLAQIEKDPDLNAIRPLPRYPELLDLARSLQGKPAPGAALMAATPLSVETGKEATVGESNTSWDWNPTTGGFYLTLLRLIPGQFDKTAYTGPAADIITPWLKAGSAAGNAGDLYVNRDSDTLLPDLAAFPGLTPVFYDDTAQRYGAHAGPANAIFRDEKHHPLPTIGSCTYIYAANTPFRRTIPRLLTLDAPIAQFQYAIANQFHTYTASGDFDPEALGDLFIANTPYSLAAAGDVKDIKPFTEAALAALAAMDPAVKAEIIRRGALTPTLQTLIRLSQKNIAGSIPAYLTAAAHPAAFSIANLDVSALVNRAHTLTKAGIQPILQIRALRYSMPKPNVDFFDASPSEGIADTPCSILRIIRGTPYTRTMTVEVMRAPTGMKLHWFIVNGDPAKIRITPRTDAMSIVDIEVDYHGAYTTHANGAPIQTRRVDIALVGVSGHNVTAPSFISLRYLANEKRTYGPQNRIAAVDYRIDDATYADPRLSARKNWKDTYRYDPAGRCTGWLRERSGEPAQRFTSRGHLIKESDSKGRPVKAVAVSYLPRRQEGIPHPVDLNQIEEPATFIYTYASDDDLIGTPRPQ